MNASVPKETITPLIISKKLLFRISFFPFLETCIYSNYIIFNTPESALRVDPFVATANELQIYVTKVAISVGSIKLCNKICGLD